MLSRIAKISGLLAASWFASSVDAERTGPIRLAPRAYDGYEWTITWTGPTTCTSWPCGYSYNVTAPSLVGPDGSIPLISAVCTGTVDQPLKACSISSQTVTVSGNFSTYETSGVGSGLIDITATWLDPNTPPEDKSLTAVTPMQATSANHNTWTVRPEGCPVTGCTNGTRTLRRGSLGLEI